MSESPLNVVWRRQVLESVLETSFIRHVLLSKVNRPQRWMAIEEGQGLPLLDNTLIVSHGDPIAYFDAARQKGLSNIGLFQVGDEKGDAGHASYALTDYVIRNYFFEHQMVHKPDRLTWVPNGWAQGVGPVRAAEHLSFTERTLPAFFSGFIGQDADQIDDRQRMLKVIDEHAVSALMATTAGFGLGLGPAAYAAHMGNARFALIPRGRSPETIRLYDALELGAIPITLDSPWMHERDGLGAFGRPPFVILKDWAELPGYLSQFQGEIAPKLLDTTEQQRLKCVDWWQQLQAHFSERVASLINSATGLAP